MNYFINATVAWLYEKEMTDLWTLRKRCNSQGEGVTERQRKGEKEMGKGGKGKKVCLDNNVSELDILGQFRRLMSLEH